MGGINDFISCIDDQQNLIMETGDDKDKHAVAHDIYNEIFKQEKL